MASGIVRQESWINEVLRINSSTDGITEVKFGYSQLYEIAPPEMPAVLGWLKRKIYKFGITVRL